MPLSSGGRQAPPVSNPPDEKGKLLAGKYELRELAGTGGMATVWRAEQHGAAGFARPVGIKRIRPELACKSDFVEMFIEEARVCAELMHPNVVQIYDFASDGGEYFLVMEWVEGLDLVRLIDAYRRRKRFAPWPAVAAIGIESLRALSAAHHRLDRDGNEAPVIHRDVSPPNILVGVNGIVKLTDFGLARAMDRVRLTSPGMIKGKLGYLAPEMARGTPANVQTDIYAMGITLWEALAGRRLFRGEDKKARFTSGFDAHVPSLVELRPALPARLAEIVHKALAGRPEDRYLTARHMARDLTNLLRTVAVATDAKVLARAVHESRRELGVDTPSRPPPPPS